MSDIRGYAGFQLVSCPREVGRGRGMLECVCVCVCVRERFHAGF